MFWEKNPMVTAPTRHISMGVRKIARLAVPGGFSAGCEPDASGAAVVARVNRRADGGGSVDALASAIGSSDGRGYWVLRRHALGFTAVMEPSSE